MFKFYYFILPPGIFITVLFGLAVILFIKKIRRLSGVMTMIAICFYVLSCSFTGKMLQTENRDQYKFSGEIAGDSILMLGEGAYSTNISVDGMGELSGNTALNVITVLKLYNKLHLPIILSGGSPYKGMGNEAQLSRRELLAMHV